MPVHASGSSRPDVVKANVDWKDVSPRLYPGWKAVLPMALLAVLLSGLLSWDPFGAIISQLYQSKQLPGSYILCSPHGATSVHTVDERDTVTECVAIDKEYVVETGPLELVQAGRSWPVFRIPAGAIIVPGISDAHCHILEYGAWRQIPLDQAKSAEEAVSILASYIKQNPDLAKNKSEVVLGGGWDHASWDNPRFPTAADLEVNPTTRGRQIILQSKDGHAVWASAASIRANEPFPAEVEGGVIVRDSDGNPAGVFMDSAQDLIVRPPVSDKALLKRFHSTVQDAFANGLTSLHDAGFKPESMGVFRREIELHGRLPIRIYAMKHFDEYNLSGNMTEGFSTTDRPGRLGVRSVKIFADGALRTGGAALYEPYSDNPSTSGQLRLSAETLKEVIPRYMKNGWQVNVHAIGDRANGIVLDAYEMALRDLNLDDASSLRPRLEHGQLLTDSDIKRIGKLGVIASVQPYHAISDMWYAETRLGPDRVKGLYAFRSLLSSGAQIAMGSDFPVEGINPLAGFYAAVTRLSTDGRSPNGPDGWFPEQRLTRLEALRGMTTGPAYASFTEGSLGSLERGKRADFVVLSKDIMTIPVEEILSTKVLATAIDGELVYGAL